MKKLILHIGAHKTGSSSIQYFLHKQRRELAKHGWEFIRLPGSLNLGRMFRWKVEKSTEFSLRPTVYKDLLRQLERSNKNCILSAEDLFLLHEPAIIFQLQRDLSRLFSEVQVLVYLRRQDKMAISQKAQGAKTKQSSLLFGHSPNPLPSPLSRDAMQYLSYDAKLSLWINAFGKSNITVGIFEKAKLINGDAVADFIYKSRLPISPRKVSLNQTLSAEATAFLHYLKANGIHHSVLWPIYKSHMIERKIGPPALPGRDQAIRFQEKFSSSNENLASLLGCGPLFDSSFDRYPVQERNPGMDIAYTSRNSKRIIRYLRRRHKAKYICLLEECAALLEITNPDLEQQLRQIARTINDSLTLKLPSPAQFHSDTEQLVAQQLHEILQLCNVVSVENAHILLQSANAIEAQNLRLAYLLTAYAYTLAPDIPRTLNMLNNYKVLLKESGEWLYRDNFHKTATVMPDYLAGAVVWGRDRCTALLSN